MMQRTISPSVVMRGFTLVELLVVVSVIGIGSLLSLVALRRSHGSAALRQAAIELSGYLQSARNQSSTATSSCVLGLNASLVLGPTATSPNSCSALPNLDLRGVTGLSSLAASGDTTVTFLARGLSSASTTTILSDPSVSQQACVFVSTPAALIKRGSRSGAGSNCDYVSGD